jgi:hypothetical protein
MPIHRRRTVFGADQVQSRKPEPVIPSKLAIPVEEPENIGIPQLLRVGTVKSAIQAVQQEADHVAVRTDRDPPAGPGPTDLCHLSRDPDLGHTRTLTAGQRIIEILPRPRPDVLQSFTDEGGRDQSLPEILPDRDRHATSGCERCDCIHASAERAGEDSLDLQ